MGECSSDMETLTDFFGIDALECKTPLLSDDTCEAWVTAGELRARSEAWRERLSGPRKLMFHYISNTVEGVAQFLGAVSAGHVIALLDPKLPLQAKSDLAARYRPGIILDNGTELVHEKLVELHPELAVLLSTSGSTGSPKFVRLSASNLACNARAIVEVLDIRAPEVGCGHLSLHYSYGLSVLTSHLIAGAPLHLTERSFLDPGFWPQMKRWRIAHLPGVPFHYNTLRRFNFAKLDLPDLRVMTQAGGNLDVRIRKMAHEYMDARGGRLHVMYGQTEAAPRITTLAHEDFEAHAETVGQALPGGRIEIVRANGDPGPEGEVIYHGPNVMMGYAETPSDLALGDNMGGRLATGDIGRLDEEGRLTITGRIKRMGKVAGLRVNLDEVERALRDLGEEFAVVGKGEGLMLYHLPNADKEALKERALKRLSDHFTLPTTAYRFQEIAEFPRTSRDKIDYQALS